MSALFPMDSEPSYNPKTGKWVPPKFGRTPKPFPCPTCRMVTLRALVDGKVEATADPIALTGTSVQAALILGRTIYRLDVSSRGTPQHLWSHFPGDDQPGEHLIPEHDCGRPPLPGVPLSTRPPPRGRQPDGPPPY